MNDDKRSEPMNRSRLLALAGLAEMWWHEYSEPLADGRVPVADFEDHQLPWRPVWPARPLDVSKARFNPAWHSEGHGHSCFVCGATIRAPYTLCDECGRSFSEFFFERHGIDLMNGGGRLGTAARIVFALMQTYSDAELWWQSHESQVAKGEADALSPAEVRDAPIRPVWRARAPALEGNGETQSCIQCGAGQIPVPYTLCDMCGAALNSYFLKCHGVDLEKHPI